MTQVRMRDKLMLDLEAANGRYKRAVDQVRQDGPSARLNWILTETLMELRTLSLELNALREI
jgi:hypothetical protein